MNSKSFIDLLFILLCATIVLLSESLQIGAVDTAPLEMGKGGVSEIRAEDVRLIAVGADTLWLDEEPLKDASALAQRFAPSQVAVLVPTDEGVTHHRIMGVWAQLNDAGLEVKLGAKPQNEPIAAAGEKE